DRHVARRHAGRRQRREGPRLQPVGHEVVVLRHDHRKPHPRRAPLALYRVHRFRSAKAFALLRPSADPRPARPARPAYLPLTPAFRFSRKAAVPSRMSSVDATRPKSVASYWHASAKLISAPLLIALTMYFMAIGALAASFAASGRTASITPPGDATPSTRPIDRAWSAVTGFPVR